MHWPIAAILLAATPTIGAETHPDAPFSCEENPTFTDLVMGRPSPKICRDLIGRAGFTNQMSPEVLEARIKKGERLFNPIRPEDVAEYHGICADLSGARSGDRFVRADLTAKVLFCARLYRTDLRGARMVHAQITGADFREAILFETDLTGAVGWESARWEGAKADDRTRLPFSRQEAERRGIRFADASLTPVVAYAP